MAHSRLSASAISVLFLCVTAPAGAGRAGTQNEKSQNQSSRGSTAPDSKQAAPAKRPSPENELQQAINNAGNDRAALLRNLEAFLKEYPESPQRPQIYRALVETSLQLQDNVRAAGYAERLVALSPEDISITIVAIQLLERNGDEAGLRRATNYATRVLDFVERSSLNEKSPKISPEEWAVEKKRDRMSVLSLRGRLELKLKDSAAAQKDFAASYAILPSAMAAEKRSECSDYTICASIRTRGIAEWERRPPRDSAEARQRLAARPRL
jgi:hypothetical protein